MHEELFPYYESELAYLRQAGAEFAQKYPAEAGALQLERTKCHDPHVERLLEGVAFLTARIRRKIDDEFPELTQPLLELLCPHMVMPVPPLGILQFTVERNEGKLTKGYHIPRKTKIVATSQGGVSCQFHTSYPVELLPLHLINAEITRFEGDFSSEQSCGARPQAQLSLGFETHGGLDLGLFDAEKIRLHLTGNPLAFRLYDLLMHGVLAIELVGTTKDGVLKRKILAAEHVQPVGFSSEEALLQGAQESFDGYRLLHEYFAFQEKFLFVDLMMDGLFHHLIGCSSLEVRFYLQEMPGFVAEHTISSANFLLGCTPIVNLFSKRAEPFKTNPAKRGYRIIPEVSKRNAYEVYQVKAVSITDMVHNEEYEIEPFYRFRHTLTPERTLYWYTRPELAHDGAREIELSFCSLGFEPQMLLNSIISVEVLCSNRNQVKELNWQSGTCCFVAEDLPNFGPLNVVSLQADSIRTPLGRSDEFWNNSTAQQNWQGGYWRLISHLTLNHLSIQEGGIEAFRALLQLYDMKGLTQNENLICGFIDIRTRSIGTLIQGAHCRGIGIDITIDPRRFGGTSWLLVTGVLDLFLSRYATMNSITRLTVYDHSEKGRVVKRWPTRYGTSKIL